MRTQTMTTGAVLSADGTTVGFRRTGSGPAVILVHGGMLAAQSFTGLAAALSDEFEVFVPDRRGRGMSGPYGDHYGMPREVEDLQVLAELSGASRIFGLSSGALAVLRTALLTPSLDKVALYEPPLSLRGSVPTHWLPKFTRQVREGKTAAAMVSVVKGLGADPTMAQVPTFLLRPILGLALRLVPTPAGDVPIRDLVPTQHFDNQLVREMADTVAEYAQLDRDVLLLGGTKSPPFLEVSLDALETVLPRSSRVTLDGLGHLGPENSGAPERVAASLRTFFA